jgi:uncharacterized membrane protein (UPF0182 family)
LAIPIAESFLWVQPLYLESEQAAAIPELKRVIVVHGNAVTMAENLPTALANSFVPGAAPPEETPPPGEEPVEPTPPPTPPPTGDVAALLAQAAQHFQAAEDLLRQGDLAGYQREIEAAQAAVEEAARLAGG